jgi:hypothetical protein
MTMSGIEGAEDATAVVLPRDVDAPAHPDADVLLVEARTIHVADAAQIPVAVEGITPSQAHGLHHTGEGVSETGVSTEAGAGGRDAESLRPVYLACRLLCCSIFVTCPQYMFLLQSTA